MAALQARCLRPHLRICKLALALLRNIAYRLQIGYFLKNLDLQNVTNAYLSGMEEDLEMFGDQLVTSTSIFTVGYVIGQIPANLLLTRVSPRWVIPAVCSNRSRSLLC